MDFTEIARNYSLPSEDKTNQIKKNIFTYDSKGIYFQDHYKNTGIYPEYNTFQASRKIYPHYHDFFEMILVVEGTGEEEIEGIKYSIEPGSLIFINHLTFHHLNVGLKAPLKMLSVSLIPSLFRLSSLFSTHPKI
jgi:mannose-6-phosphate isomerase-like protein (cupin superfamily)